MVRLVYLNPERPHTFPASDLSHGFIKLLIYLYIVLSSGQGTYPLMYFLYKDDAAYTLSTPLNTRLISGSPSHPTLEQGNISLTIMPFLLTSWLPRN